MGSKNSTSSSSSSNSNSNSNAGAGDRSNNPTKKATKAVKKAVSFSQTKHPTEGIVDSYTFKNGKKNQMYGGQVSQATNDYLVSIGEAKKTGGGGYMLTSKGWKIKYGSYNAGGPQSGMNMGTGGAGVMNKIPISEKMFQSQQKTKALLVGGLSVFGGPVVGSIMRMGAADSLNKTYGDYRKSFTANKGMGSVQSPTIENTDVANLAIGETETNYNSKKSKTTKKTSKFFAGMGVDESTKKRTFYS